ncbi:hypothetical protein D9M68_571240 [compost metagenome]
MSNPIKGRPPRVAAGIITVMRRYAYPNGSKRTPVTVSVLRSAPELKDVPKVSVMHALRSLRSNYGMQSRCIPGTRIHEYCLGSRAFALWGIGDVEQDRQCARLEGIAVTLSQEVQ